MATKQTPSATPRPEGYILGDSGIPNDIKYLGDMSVSAASDSAYITVAEPNRLEYGRLPLGDVGTANNFTIRAPLTANAATASLEPQEIRISLREATTNIFTVTGGASALVFFVKTANGTSLSGAVILGPTI